MRSSALPIMVRCTCTGRADVFREPETEKWRAYCTVCRRETPSGYSKPQDARSAWGRMIRRSTGDVLMFADPRKLAAR